MWLARFSVRNTVLVNLVMATVLVLGTYAYIALPRELTPEFKFNWAFITTFYPGAAPEEIEQLVTEPIEEAIEDVEKIDLITSNSSESVSFISVKFEQNLSDDEFNKRFQQLQSQTNSVVLPDAAEEPDVMQLDSNSWMPVISVVVSGDIQEAERKRIAEDVEDLLTQDPAVGKITIAGLRDREVWVEVDQDRIDRLGISLDEVLNALRMKNVNVPGGAVRSGRSEYLLRTLGQFEAVDEVRDVVVRSHASGHQVRVRDVATITDTFEEASSLSRLNGLPAITLNIAKKSGASTLKVVDYVNETIERYRAERLPTGAHLDLINDTSIFIKDSIRKLQSNAGFGVVFVLASLLVFVGWRTAMVVVVGMPITFGIALSFLYFTGGSLNWYSLFALVLVLGMIVDHAIVMAENCYRHIQMGKAPARAVVDGVGEVLAPVLTATLTTMAAFLPLILMPGIMGTFMKIVPIVVALALTASMFEAFFILPSHVADWSKPTGSREGPAMRILRPMRLRYVRALSWVLRHRYWVTAAIVLVFPLSALLIPLVGVDMFGGDAMSAFWVNLWMPPGTELEETDRVVRQLERTAMSLPDEDLDAVITTTGYLNLEDSSESNSRVGQLLVDLPEDYDRERSVEEIIADLRLRVQSVTGYERLTVRMISGGPPTGKAVEVKVKGPEFAALEAIAGDLKAALADIPGVYDIGDDFSPGKQEIRIQPREDRVRLHNLSAAQVAGFVQTAINGRTATTFRQGDDDVDVVVKFAGADDYSLERIKAMKIPTPTGALIPIREVAEILLERGYSDIPRFEGSRAITVSAEVDSSVVKPVAVNRMIEERFADVGQAYPGYRLDFRGQFAEFKEAFSSLTRLFVLGTFIIFILLTAQFKSFTQPFIILLTVPFSFTGALIGLLVANYPFSITTLYGIVALAGIVVNDSIVLIDFVNIRRRDGWRKWRSILEAGRLRLRPIVLTTITTIAGLLPMATGLGGSSEMWQPLALTIIWGLAMATFLTLFVIPCLYAISEDVAWLRRRRERSRLRHEQSAAVAPGMALDPGSAD